jgi:hypothetical protein
MYESLMHEQVQIHLAPLAGTESRLLASSFTITHDRPPGSSARVYSGFMTKKEPEYKADIVALEKHG